MIRRSTVTALLRLANATHGPASVHELNGAAEPSDHDHLASGVRLRAFMAAYAITTPASNPSDRELDALRAIRSATRALAEKDATTPWESAVGRLLGHYTFRLKLDGGLIPTDTGWQAFIAERLRELVVLVTDPRGLRLCEADSCRWLFLDDTRNQRRRWCDMATCGSRAKMRSYRARQRSSSSPVSPQAAGRHALPGRGGELR